MNANAATLKDVTSFFDSIKVESKKSPARFLFYGPEGVGKTSFAAQSKDPVIIQSKGETGAETLISSGQIAPTPHVEVVQWEAYLDGLKQLREGKHDYKTCVVDTLNGVENLLYDFVCREDYGGRWSGGKDSFMSWHQGYRAATNHWQEMLDILDDLRSHRNMAVILLAHQQVTSYDNPEGSDYHRITPDLYKEQYHLVRKWTDGIIYLNFLTEVNDDGKGVDGTTRVGYTERRAAFDAKNRYGLGSFFSLGENAQEAWSNFTSLFKKKETK